MNKITENLYQGSVHTVERGVLLKLPISATIAVGFNPTPSIGSLINNYHEVLRYHLPLIEFLPDWKVIKEHGKRFRLSTAEEIISAIELVHKLIEGGHTVFLHCDAGACRSVGIAGGYLVRSGRAPSIEEAYHQMNDHCDFNFNPFEITLKEVCDSKYWTEFQEYFDMINLIPGNGGIFL